jgi:amino acid adenylation domain-containing protein
LSLAGPAESYNETDTEYPRDSTIAQQFEQQAARTPDAVAVVSAGTSLTYRELDQRSNQLAHYLQQLGLKPDKLVGVAMERSSEMLIGLLAILKAGGAYVPMDPSYPAQRIALMMEDSDAQVILATEHTRPYLGKASRHIVSVDGDATAIGAMESNSVLSTANGQNLAYVIYTSGSTGKPKGVMIEHHNVVNFFTGMDRAIGAEPGVWLAVTSISFDISVLELFWTLTRGFKVILHGDEGVQTIPDEIRRHGVTHLQSTPSLARMIALNSDGLASLGQLKKLFLGGEALPVSLVRQLRGAFHGDMFNMYGPTETTIWSTICPIIGDPDVIPIGRPIANTQVYVVDSLLQTVPPGEAGDLYIGGDGVVRGYWQRPELTAERFPENPFRPGTRMYRTGDIARYLPDGNLEFLGRSDFQVKLRGFRIEFGEIEAAIESQPAVGQAAVAAIEFKPEDKRLVAYVVPKPGLTLEIAALREALAITLPEYMVPSVFVPLSEFPLTPNGKIDRKALPSPTALEDEPVAPQELPRNELERMITEAWKDALGTNSVGLNENFFDLGAHSLMVAEVHAQLQIQLDREFSLVDLFQFPTVTALANHLQGKDAPPQLSSRIERRLAARQRRGARS